MAYFKIYIINGSGGSGKDTFCDLVWLAMNEADPHCFVHKYYTSAPAKKWASLMGWDEKTKQPMDRRFLCELKDMLDYWSDITHKYLLKKINDSCSLTSFNRKILFLHAREDKDIAWIKEYCCRKGIYCKTIKVNRKILNENGINENNKYGNHADDGVSKSSIVYDYIIDNNGTKTDLQKKVHNFIYKEELFQ